MRFFFLAILAIFSMLADSASAQEHVFPREYFPAYPGSHWTFVNANGDTLTDSVAADYNLVEVPDGLGMAPKAAMVFAPMMLTRHWASFQHPGPGGPISGYRMAYYNTTNGNVGWNWVEFFSEKRGISWLYMYNYRCGSVQNIPCIMRWVVAVDTSVSVLDKQYDSVVVIRTENGSEITMEYYAKHIGPILIERQGARLQLSSYSIRRDARKSQRIRVDSVQVGQYIDFVPVRRAPVDWLSHRADWWKKWGSDGTEIFPRYSPTIPSRIALQHTKPAGDTLQVVARSTSGNPVEITKQGLGTMLGNGHIAFPWTFGHIEVTITQAGDSLYRAAPVFKGSICVYPKPQVERITEADGRVFLHTNYHDSGVWTFTPEELPFDTLRVLEGATDSIHLPLQTGYYAFRAIDRNPAPAPCGNWVESDRALAKAQTISIAPGRDPKSVRPAQIRVLGGVFRTWGGMEGMQNPTWTLWRQDGGYLGSLDSRREQDRVVVEARRPLTRGVYLVRACEGRACHMGKVTVLGRP